MRGGTPVIVGDWSASACHGWLTDKRGNKLEIFMVPGIENIKTGEVYVYKCDACLSAPPEAMNKCPGCKKELGTYSRLFKPGLAGKLSLAINRLRHHAFKFYPKR